MSERYVIKPRPASNRKPIECGVSVFQIDLFRTSKEGLPVFQSTPTATLPETTPNLPVHQGLSSIPQSAYSPIFRKGHSTLTKLLIASTVLIPMTCGTPYESSLNVPHAIPSITPVSSDYEIPAQENIFSISSEKLIINPVNGFGVSSYAQVIASVGLEELVNLSKESQLQLVQDAHVTKATLPYVKTISEMIVFSSSSAFENIDLSVSGFKDPSKNRLTGGLLKLNLDSNPALFKYDSNFPDTIEDDKLTVAFLVPGAGVASYALALAEDGWTPENILRVSHLPLLEQVSLVKKHIPTNPKSHIDGNSLTDILAATISYNLDTFDEPDPSNLGLRDSHKNIVHISDQARIYPNFSVEQVLASEADYRNSGSILEKIAREYLDVSTFDVELGYPHDDNQRALKSIALEIASVYNSSKLEGTSGLNSFSRSERLQIACALYKNTNFSHDANTYMTMDDILRQVNANQSETISQREILSSTAFRRSKVQHDEMEKRRAQILEDYMSAGPNVNKFDFIETASRRYGVSRYTIGRDLNLLNQTAIDPKYLF